MFASLHVADTLELRVSEDMIVITKKQMSVNNLWEAANELMLLGGKFSESANEICTGCDG